MSTGELLEQRALQGLWHLNGDFVDSSVNGYSLTGVNTPADVIGKFRGGKNFIAASSQAATIADASCANLEIANAQTWMAWIYPTIVGVAEKQIMFKGPSGGTKNLAVAATGAITFRLVGLTPDALTSTRILAVNNWHFVVGRYDTASLAVFVNGHKTESASTGSGTDTNDVFAIGRQGNTAAQYFDGVIDECAVYSRAWTDKEIQDYYSWSKGQRTFLA